MIAFPVLDRLCVDDFGMFPGKRGSPGLDIDFSGGTTLILGANGLGKTTLITLLYRLCAGPSELRNLAQGAALGGRSRDVRTLSRSERRQFAMRVIDDAETATATLAFRLGNDSISVRRSLRTLDILSLTVNDASLSTAESEYQRAVVRAAGVSQFADWLLLLRFITFYFEDRRALVWDPSAQRQLLRMMFLPVDVSKAWSTLETEVLQRDSNMRNLQASLTMAENQMFRSDAAVADSPRLRQELTDLQRAQTADDSALEFRNERLVQLEAEQELGRLNALRADLARESAYRDLERRQLHALSAAFPTHEATAQYLLSKLFTEGRCLTCGHEADAAATAMTKQLRENRCVICGSRVADGAESGIPFSSRAIVAAEKALSRAETQREHAQTEKDAAESAFRTLVTEIGELRAAITSRSARIDSLVSRLPPDEAELHKAREELSAIRGRVEEMRLELDAARAEFTGFIRDASRRIAQRANGVQHTFSQFADGFLLEDCVLSYHLHKDKVGQSGQLIGFPAFELDMTSSTFVTPVRREGPDKVSESQREFIDLAFRMTLMTEAGEGGVGSLIIDAPESSLDAVFVTRAADVLTRFSKKAADNRLVVTSNLVEGNLIPELLHRTGISAPDDSRIVDLLALAAPTAATRELAAEYKQVRKDLFARAVRRR
jgi:DNA-directed RNA polymerase subunit RPC12/RpoP